MRKRHSARQWALLLAALLMAAPAPAQEAADPTDAAVSDEDADREPAEDADPGADAEPAEDADQPLGAPELGAPELDDEIEEIIVEGTTTETTLEVPTSVTTFSGSDVQELRIQDIADLSEFTPNLEINTAFAASNPTLFIRGIGLKDYNANSASAVAVYQDGVQMNSPAGQLFTMFDVESVKILRGPQGSLNARNATAGAIIVDSVKPDGEWGSTGSFVYGNYNDVEVEGAISFPIADEWLSGRLAFSFQQRDGFTKNRCSGWDPEAEGFITEPAPGGRGVITYVAATEEALREEYYKDKAAGNLPPKDGSVKERYNIGDTDRNNRQAKLNEAGLDATAMRLRIDTVCVTEEPGDIVTWKGAEAGFGAEGDFIPKATHTSLEDLSGLKSHTNNADNWAARGILRAQPLAGMDLLFNAHGGMNRSDSFHLQMLGAEAVGLSTQQERVVTDQKYRESLNNATNGWSEVAAGETPVEIDGLEPPVTEDYPVGLGGADPFLGWYNRDGQEILDVMGFSLTARQEFDAPHWWVPSRVTSVTGYEWNERTVGVDGDGSPTSILLADYYDTTWQVSEGLRVEGEGERLWWVLGGLFFYEELESTNRFPSTIGRDLTQEFEQDLTSYAGFLHGRYDFADHLRDLGAPDLLAGWSLEAGVRYGSETKTFDLQSEITVLETGVKQPQIAGGDEGTWKGWTGDVTLSYAPVEEGNIYAKYSHGLKAGHFNAGLTINPGRCPEGTPEAAGCQTITAVEPEYIDAVELGTKLNAFGGALQVSAAWFRYWYQDLQVFDIVNEDETVPTQQLLNSDANVMGVELEIQARPLVALPSPWDGISLQLGGGWLDSEFIDFSVTKVRVIGGAGTGGKFKDTYEYDGNPLIAAPEWNLSGMVEWEIPISRWGSIVPSYNFSYRSRVALDPSNDPLISQPGYWLHNARLAYRTPDGQIEIAGWVRNLTDEQYLVDVFDLTLEYQTFLQVWGDPRMYGLNISYLW